MILKHNIFDFIKIVTTGLFTFFPHIQGDVFSYENISFIIQAKPELNLICLVHEKVKLFNVVKIRLSKTFTHSKKGVFDVFISSVPIATLLRTKSIPFIEEISEKFLYLIINIQVCLQRICSKPFAWRVQQEVNSERNNIKFQLNIFLQFFM